MSSSRSHPGRAKSCSDPLALGISICKFARISGLRNLLVLHLEERSPGEVETVDDVHATEEVRLSPTRPAAYPK